MKSDCELLELAAKAAGYDVRFELDSSGDYRPRVVSRIYIQGFLDREWDPIHDDGDALRLAVILDMSIEVNRVDEVVTVISGYSGEHRAVEMLGDCMFAATRLAIVRAAASIGEAIS